MYALAAFRTAKPLVGRWVFGISLPEYQSDSVPYEPLLFKISVFLTVRWIGHPCIYQFNGQCDPVCSAGGVFACAVETVAAVVALCWNGDAAFGIGGSGAALFAAGNLRRG